MGQLLAAIGLVSFAVFYALLCRWTGEFANKKGYSYWVFALLSFLWTPIVGVLIARILPERAEGHRVPLRNSSD